MVNPTNLKFQNLKAHFKSFDRATVITGAKVLALISFIIVFLLTRLINLLILPIFVDEGIHLSWALKIADTGQWLGTIDVGKYLPIWLYALFISRAPDLLWAGRFFSVISGLLAALGLFWLGQLLYSYRVGFVAAWLYLMIPFTLFYDRMVLVDTFLTMLLIYTFNFSIQWYRKGNWFWGILLGVTMGGAAISKLYGALVMLIPLVVITLSTGVNKKQLFKKLFWIYGIAFLVMIPNFVELPNHINRIASKSGLVYSGEVAFLLVFDNLLLSLTWLTSYLTLVGFTLVSLSTVYIIFSRNPIDLTLLLVSAIWLALFIVFARNWYSRYLLPIIPMLLLVIAQHGVQLSNTLAVRFNKPLVAPLVQFSLVSLLALSVFRFDKSLLTDPVQAPLPAIDRWQYIEGWPSGYQLDNVVNYFKNETAKRGPLIVVRDRDPGPLQEGLNLSLRENQYPIILSSLDLGNLNYAQLTQNLANQNFPIYLVIDQSVVAQPLIDVQGQFILDLIAVFPKPGHQSRFEIYQVKLP